ncbi:MAG: transposase zinc-binding domain-containing protein [Candidatus Promineofilum sp.]|uniref:transposase zinc-binding domain-containing protein n=1 Tax=Promineifilum sp. TaxID=2664178 RepID=UPI002411ABB0|nr:transposase zinc-binding domain-containing protein [Promineifilum sp.]
MVWDNGIDPATPEREWEIADVFRAYFGCDHLKGYHCTAQEFKAVNAILRCRTAAMGGYIRLCDTCGNVEVAYCSCKNRHCPKCGHLEKVQWVAGKKRGSCRCPTFRSSSRLDHGINDIARINPKAIYNLLFRVAGKLLKEYGRRYLGGKRKQMTLSAVEFMRRFLLHVLPKGFVRIRHYGLYASGMRTKLRIVRMILGCSLESSAPPTLELGEWLNSFLEEDPFVCPLCGEGRMCVAGAFAALGRLPRSLLMLLRSSVLRETPA